YTCFCCCFFFFSSRRRHTRFSRDWSSDVCSSDLMSPVCGGLKLMVPANDLFSAITSVSITSETDILTGTVEVREEDGQIELLEEQASKKVTLKGEIDISDGQQLFIALPPITFTGALNIKFTTLKGMGTCTIDLTGESIKSGKVLGVELDDIEW